MTQERLASIQLLIEELESENATGKVILFFEDGEIKAIEIDRKIKIHIPDLSTEIPIDIKSKSVVRL